MSSPHRISNIGREASKILRHNPPPGTMDKQGWMHVDILIKHMKTKPTYDEIVEAVEVDSKQRFVLDTNSTPIKIRAAQGHSVKLEDPPVDPVTDSNQVELALHVTGVKGWESIQESGELRSMSRTHLHFATKASHMRKNAWATVYLRLKLKEAINDGHKFFLSSNGVLLTPGPLPIQYVQHIEGANLLKLFE
jgi:2'-phosphotransferase